jgi:hypothetical protein
MKQAITYGLKKTLKQRFLTLEYSVDAFIHHLNDMTVEERAIHADTIREAFNAAMQSLEDLDKYQMDDVMHPSVDKSVIN